MIPNTIWVSVFEFKDSVGGFGGVVVAASVADAPLPLPLTGTILNVTLVGYSVFPLRPVMVYDAPVSPVYGVEGSPVPAIV